MKKKVQYQQDWLEHQATFLQSNYLCFCSVTLTFLPSFLYRKNKSKSFSWLILFLTPNTCFERSVKELQVTPKVDVFAFGVVLAELITGQRALFRDNRVPNKMKTLITIVSCTILFTRLEQSKPRLAIFTRFIMNLY